MRWLIALPLTLCATWPAAAGDVASSDPLDVLVTIYRDPGRNGGSIQLSSLGGFAVITETRRVTIPAGRSRLRFEGVVDGIIPESAIVTGLPGGVIEKNRDAALLSPSSLMRAARGHILSLKRTDPVTGKVVFLQGEIIAASEQGVVFKTATGVESLHCSGLPETFRYSSGAEGLSARPTLSVQTRSAKAITAKVTLTYIAEQFDWSANYTAYLNADGKTMDVGGWITLANGNSVSLNNAQTQIVAGGLNREYFERFVNDQPEVIARCWPMQKTSDVPRKPERPYGLVHPYLPTDYERYEEGSNEEIMVTAQRRGSRFQPVPAPVAVTAYDAAPLPPPPPPEQLGDLKLYRVPQRTTVAAQQLKQTRLIEQKGVPVERLYRATVSNYSTGGDEQPGATTILRTRNDKEHKLGLPLPAGSFLIEQDQYGRAMLVGEPLLVDTAEGEKVELVLGQAPDVAVKRRALSRDQKTENVEVMISNAGSSDIVFELELTQSGTMRVAKADHPFEQRNGRPMFVLTVPANQTVTVHYTSARE